MDLTKLPRYQFAENGVGCKKHFDPACLCDVVVAQPVEVATNWPTASLAAEIATQFVGDPTIGPNRFYEWAQILLTAHTLQGYPRVVERASGTSGRYVAAALRGTGRRRPSPHHRIGGPAVATRAEVLEALRDRSLGGVADDLGVPVREVLRILMRGSASALFGFDDEKLLAFDASQRTPTRPAPAEAKHWGVDRNVVLRWRAMLVTPPEAVAA